jgi:hypothetical protein
MADDVPAGGSDEAFDPNEFLVVGPLWFVAPFPRPADPLAFVRTVGRLVPEGGGEPVVPAFTERAHAEEWIEERGEQGGPLKPFPCTNPAAQIVFLETLLAIGFATLTLDPKGTRVPLFPIAAVLDAMRNRRR